MVYTARPRPLHGEPVLALPLPVPEPHLLEEDVRGVVGVVPAPREGAPLGEEVVEAARQDAAAVGVSGGDGAEEGGLGDAWSAEGGADVTAGGVACVVDGNGVVGLAGQRDGGDVEVGGGLLEGAGLFLLGLCCLWWVRSALRARVRSERWRRAHCWGLHCLIRVRRDQGRSRGGRTGGERRDRLGRLGRDCVAVIVHWRPQLRSIKVDRRIQGDDRAASQDLDAVVIINVASLRGRDGRAQPGRPRVGVGGHVVCGVVIEEVEEQAVDGDAGLVLCCHDAFEIVSVTLMLVVDGFL